MMSEFEKQVRHALIDRDMTMTDLANELGITISYVSDLLKGKRTNQEQLQRIKEVFDLTNKKQLGEYHGLSQGQGFLMCLSLFCFYQVTNAKVCLLLLEQQNNYILPVPT